MKITPTKAIEILEINLKEAGLKMPLDCRIALQLANESLGAILIEREVFGFSRIIPLPHEEMETKS